MLHTMHAEEVHHQPVSGSLRGHFPKLPSLAFGHQNSSFNLAPNPADESTYFKSAAEESTDLLS